MINILDDFGWHVDLEVNKPLAPQIKQGAIKRMQGKVETPDALKYPEQDKKILEKMKTDALKYGKAHPWFNEVDPTKPLAPQVKAFYKRQAAEQRARRLQQEQGGIEDDENDSGWYLHEDK